MNRRPIPETMSTSFETRRIQQKAVSRLFWVVAQMDLRQWRKAAISRHSTHFIIDFKVGLAFIFHKSFRLSDISTNKSTKSLEKCMSGNGTFTITYHAIASTYTNHGSSSRRHIWRGTINASTSSRNRLVLQSNSTCGTSIRGQHPVWGGHFTEAPPEQVEYECNHSPTSYRSDI